MDEACIRMYCESEGRCHGIVLVFFKEEQKKKILLNIDELSLRHRVVPDISIRMLDNRGEVFIEFYDNYHKEDRCFFEDLVETLDVKLCDCED